ncbi:MAG TPA: hypothetical protein VHM19_04480, partial [Polyangiales bacterium]|nr:hypothetical protein [Polyangiales bacterium]
RTSGAWRESGVAHASVRPDEDSNSSAGPGLFSDMPPAPEVQEIAPEAMVSAPPSAAPAAAVAPPGPPPARAKGGGASMYVVVAAVIAVVALAIALLQHRP